MFFEMFGVYSNIFYHQIELAGLEWILRFNVFKKRWGEL